MGGAACTSQARIANIDNPHLETTSTLSCPRQPGQSSHCWGLGCEGGNRVRGYRRAERLLQALSELGESLQDPQLLQRCSERKVASHTLGRGGAVQGT